MGDAGRAKDECTYTGDCRAVTRFTTRSEVRFRFPQSPNLNFSMGFRSEDLLDWTLNRRSGSGSNQVLEVREPDHGQSTTCRPGHPEKWAEISATSEKELALRCLSASCQPGSDYILSGVRLWDLMGVWLCEELESVWLRNS